MFDCSIILLEVFLSARANFMLFEARNTWIADIPFPFWGGLSLMILGGVVWLLPKWQVNGIDEQIEVRDRAFIEDAHRRTLIQALGGLFFLTTAYLSRRNLQITEGKEVTERFSKAVEMLGDERLEVRLGGIYLLERVAKDSPSDHWIVMEVLTSYIRDKTAFRSQRMTNMPTDIQAALTVISRRNVQNDLPGGRLDLSKTDLSRAELTQADLSNANLQAANLAEANLSAANLSGANLIKMNAHQANLSAIRLNKADCSSANFSQANLFEGELEAANLLKVNFSEANLTKANLSATTLVEANLKGTDFSKANLKEANLIGANLSEANLLDANLRQADLRSAANLTMEQIQAAAINDAIYDQEFRDQLQQEFGK